MTAAAAAVSVVVPFTPGDESRNRNWAWIRARYQHLHPGWELIQAADPKPNAEWSKGRAVRSAVDQSTGDLLVVADADVFVTREALEQTVHLVATAAPWAMPHSVVYRLSDIETINITSRAPNIEPRPLPAAMLERRRHPSVRGGGIVICTRDAFERVGGIDPRFTGWGGEDISFARALDALVGCPAQRRSPMWHLHHPRMTRRPGNRGSPDNEALAGEYKDAAGNPVLMDRLVGGHRGRTARDLR